MKELTIEEKAKAYDKALDLIKDCIPDEDGYVHVRPEDIFSELAESEDERIRKALINGFNKLDKSAVWYNGITNAQILAWLERQGQDGKVWFYRDDYVRDKKQAYQDGIDNVLNNPQKYGLEKQGEQKPVEWSDKDETGWTNTMIMIKECAANHYTKDSIDFVINWLKSLKNRCLTQPKQEWSEEDKKMLGYAIKAVHYMYVGKDRSSTSELYCKVANWLKSLKDRVQPKQEWGEEDERNMSFVESLIIAHTSLVNRERELLDWLKSLRPQEQ